MYMSTNTSQYEQAVNVNKRSYIHHKEFLIQPFIQEVGIGLLFIPEVLQNNFFKGLSYTQGNASHSEQHYFAIVDCAKSTLFPTLFNQYAQTETLFGEDIADSLHDVSPQLTQICVDEHQQSEFLRGCFTQSDNPIFSFWDVNPAIFIRTNTKYTFKKIHDHLVKFIQIYNEKSEKWCFFRFYDPLVLAGYLEHLSPHPERLATFFGVKNGEPLIESFALRIGSTFHTFDLLTLPEETKPYRFEYGAFEEEVLKKIELKKLLVDTIINDVREAFPNKSFTEQELVFFVSQAMKLGFKTKGQITRLVKAQCHLVGKDITIKLFLAKIKHEYSKFSLADISKLVYEKAK